MQLMPRTRLSSRAFFAQEVDLGTLAIHAATVCQRLPARPVAQPALAAGSGVMECKTIDPAPFDPAWQTHLVCRHMTDVIIKPFEINVLESNFATNIRENQHASS